MLLPSLPISPASTCSFSTTSLCDPPPLLKPCNLTSLPSHACPTTPVHSVSSIPTHTPQYLPDIVPVGLHQHLRRVVVHVHPFHLGHRLDSLGDGHLLRPREPQVVAVVGQRPVGRRRRGDGGTGGYIGGGGGGCSVIEMLFIVRSSSCRVRTKRIGCIVAHPPLFRWTRIVRLLFMAISGDNERDLRQ